MDIREMDNISGSFIALGIISFLFPLIITVGYLAVRNKRITRKLLFLTAGTSCCFGVRFFAAFIMNEALRFFIDPQKTPTSSNPFTVFSVTFNILIEAAVYWLVLAYLEKKLNREKAEQRKDDGNLIVRDTVIFSLGVLFGSSIWLASSTIFGKKEAFDSPYYILVLVIGGALCSFFSKDRSWRWVVAILIGQVIGFALLVMKHSGPLWPLGVFFILLYSSVTFLGTFLGASINSRFK